MSESDNVPQLIKDTPSPLALCLLRAARRGRQLMKEPTRWGVFFKWHKEDEDDEWLCDHQGTVFVFDFRDEAEAQKALLDVGGGMDIEVLPYEGDEPTREYPWPAAELIAV